MSVLSLRMHELYRFDEQLHYHLNALLRLVSQERHHCETLSFCTLYEEEEWSFPSLSVGVVRSAGVGQPRLKIAEELLKALHTRAGFCWAAIA